MATHDVAAVLFDTLAPHAVANGLELVDLEVVGAAHEPVVRVYLDREGGIDIDAIAEANSWVRPLLDGRRDLDEAYTLEVSSPGIDRPVRGRADFVRFAGEQVKVACGRPVEGRKRFTGRIEGVEGETVVLDDEGKTYRIPLDAVSQARLVGELGL